MTFWSDFTDLIRYRKQSITEIRAYECFHYVQVAFKSLFCGHKLCALELQVWYLKLPTYCTRQTEPFMVWNEQSSSVCLFCFAKRVRKNKKEIRCGSIVTVGKTHTTMKTENNNNANNTTNAHEHRAQKRMFLISNFFFYCSIVTIQYWCLSAVVSFVSRAQSKHGISTVNMAEK